MTKNVLSNTAYRKLDVDAFDPDKFIDGDEAETPVGQGPDEGQVRQFLQANQNVEALKAALSNAPLRTKNQALKDKTTSLVVRVLTSFKSAEIEAALKSLSAEEMDLLMKYIYKGMELLPDGQNCASLLAWHSQVFNVCGHGGIVRVYNDRQRL
ncbi:hypothetical protein niasHS_000581 [Heterodera schachtii]|uniref:Actin-related protein 2/3 complex subunit 5 n=2 Tax=Heterodera TaxID=34509 RepID=A0ABD2K4M6_HETSC